MKDFISLRMLTLSPDRASQRDQLVADLKRAAAGLEGLLGCWIAPVSATAVIGAGDVVWRMRFATEGASLAAPLQRAWRQDVAPLLEHLAVCHVGYRMTEAAVNDAGPGIWRALVFRCFPHSDPALVRAMLQTTLLLPRYIDEIRSWGLSKVAYCEGAKTFEFVWEQEFGTIGDLTGPYMTKPIHWGVADAFFDADCPEYIVDPQLIQVVGAIDRTIM